MKTHERKALLEDKKIKREIVRKENKVTKFREETWEDYDLVDK